MVGSTLSQTADVLKQLSGFDILSISDAVAGIASIRYDVLNESIQSLADIVRPLANLVNFFS